MGWLARLLGIGKKPQANQVFTNRVSPQLQARAQDSYEDPRQTFRQNLRPQQIQENIVERMAPFAARQAQYARELPKGIATAAAAPFMSGEQLLKFNPRVVDEDYAKQIGGTFFNVATAAVAPAVSLPEQIAARATTPLAKLAAYGALRGTENVAFGAGSRAVNTGDISQVLDPRAAARDFAMGAAFNTALSPRLTAKAGGQVAENFAAGFRPDPATGMLPRSPGFLRLPGEPTELAVTHNLSAENLAKAEQLGGLPQPSIGIVDPKKGIIDGFGDITLVGNQDLVRPSRQTSTYASDAYTPRQPRIDPETGKLWAGTTPSGANRWIDETMDNVLKLMRKESKTSADSFGGIGAIRAATTPKFKSLEDIVKNKDRLTTEQAMEAIKETLSNKVFSAQTALEKYAVNKSSNQFTEFDRQMAAIKDYFQGDIDSLNYKFPNLPPEGIAILENLKKDLATAPTAYFESVSNRAVSLKEFEKALIPEGSSREIVDRLNRQDIQPVFYKEGERQAMLNRLIQDDNRARGFTPKPSASPGFARVPGKPSRPGVPEDFGDIVPTSNGKFVAWDTIRNERLYKPGSKGADIQSFDTLADARKALDKRFADHRAGKATPYNPQAADPLETLHTEARKYKSAEEFVKANQNNENEAMVQGRMSFDSNGRPFLDRSPKPEMGLAKPEQPQPSRMPEGANFQPQEGLVSSPDSLKRPQLNVKRMKVSEPAKQELTKAVEDIRPELEKNFGKPLSHDEVVAGVADVKRELTKVMTREETATMGARMLQLRQKIAGLAEETAKTGRATPELLEALETDLSNASNLGRLLGQRRIDAEPVTKTIIEQYMRSVMKAGAALDDIKRAAEGVNFNDPTQATEFYRQFVKPGLGEWVDLLRYNSMLSSPLTQVINITSNIASAPVRAATKIVAGGVDWLGSTISGKPRTQFAGEGIAYLGGYANSLGKAYKNLVASFKGELPSDLLDFRESRVPLATKGFKGKLATTLSAPMQLLEGMDQFFMTASGRAEDAALGLRAAKGGRVPSSLTGRAAEAERGAKYSIFRTELGDETQGTVLKAIDELALQVSAFRRNKNKLVSTLAKFTFPFLHTPTNIAKQGLEYSPLGFATIPGAANKTEQVAKAVMGSAVFATAAGLLTSDRITWGEPTSATEKLKWKQAGRQAYSVKIGGTWYAYNKLHPSIAFPFAMVAAVNDASENRRIDDNDLEFIMSAVAKSTRFFFDQSYMKSMGEFLTIGRGDAGGITRQAGNYLQQVFPMRAFGGWFARALDGYERTTSKGAGFWQKQLELFMQNVPGLRGLTPARLDEYQEPIPAARPGLNAVSPVRSSPANDQGEQDYQLYREDLKVKREASDLRQSVKDEIFNENARSGTGVQAAETSLKPLKDGEMQPGIQKRGSYYVYRIDGEVKMTKDLKAANMAVLKDNFKNSGKNFEIVGDLVLRRDRDGSISTKGKDEYDIAISTNKRQRLKKDKNFKEWLKVADAELALYKKQWNDPTLDELERSEIEEKASNLLDEYAKYKGYGGFTKGKKAKKAKAARIASIRSIKSPGGAPGLRATKRARRFRLQPKSRLKARVTPGYLANLR